MPSAPEHPAADRPELPGGPPRAFWFDGIVEGPRPEGEELRRCVEALQGPGGAQAALEIDGGRFSLLAPEGAQRGAVFDRERKGAILAAIQELQEACEARGGIESTLRITEVYERRTVESLLAVHDGKVRWMSRVRPVAAGDRVQVGGGVGPGAVPVGRRTLWALAIGGILLAAVVGAGEGWFAALGAPAAAGIEASAGPFDGLLLVAVEDDGLGYRAILRRGPRWPANPAEAEELRRGAETLLEAAAVGAVVAGGALDVEMLDGEGQVLAVERAALLSLLEGGRNQVLVRLPGHRAVRRIALSLAEK